MLVASLLCFCDRYVAKCSSLLFLCVCPVFFVLFASDLLVLLPFLPIAFIFCRFPGYLLLFCVCCLFACHYCTCLLPACLSWTCFDTALRCFYNTVFVIFMTLAFALGSVHFYTCVPCFFFLFSPLLFSLFCAASTQKAGAMQARRAGGREDGRKDEMKNYERMEEGTKGRKEGRKEGRND